MCRWIDAINRNAPIPTAARGPVAAPAPLTIIGPGGIRKTSVALAVAEALLATYDHIMASG
jgi:hypothetical protein